MTPSPDAAAATIERNRRLSAEPLRETGRRGHLLTGFFIALGEVWQRRELLDLLIKREIKARYKDSALGFVWGLVRPLTQLLIYYLVLGHFLGAARNIPEFAVFIFAGLTLYGLAAEIIMTMTASIVGNAGLVKKVYLPREIFPLAAAGSTGFNFLMQIFVLLGAALLSGTLVLGWHFVYAIAGVVVVVIWALALGLAMSALNVYLRDMQYLIEVIVMLLMWFSPIVYFWQFVGDAFAQFHLPAWLAEAYLANPLTLGVLGFQAAFWAPGVVGTEPFPDGVPFPEHLMLRMIVAAAVGLVTLFLAQRLFSRLQGNFAQEL